MRRACSLVLLTTAALVVASVLGGCAYQKAAFLDYAPTRGVDLPAPPADKARVILFLRIANKPGETLTVYHEGQRVGVLRYITWTQLLVDPGEQRFGVVTTQNADFTVGKLEGGRTYLLEAQQIFATYRYRLEPVGLGEDHYGISIPDILASLYHVEPNAQLAVWLQKYGPAYQQRHDDYLAKWLTKPPDERRRITPDLAIEGPTRFLQPPPSEGD